MTELTIRLAREDEFDEVDRLIESAYAHDYGPSEHDHPSRFARNRAVDFDVWVARDPAGELLGSVTTRRAGGLPLQEDAAADELDLRLLGVAPTARRRGIGARIMAFVIDEAGRHGYTGVFLKSAPNMTSAHRLYEALGFQRAPERDGLWIDGEKVFDLLSFTYLLGAPSPQPGAPE